MYCSLPGSSVHRLFQTRILEWVAISFSRGSSRPRDQTQVSCIVGRCNYRLSRQGSPQTSEDYRQTKGREFLVRSVIPGGPSVKNLSAIAGNTHSILGPGRSHTPRNNKGCGSQLPNPRLGRREATAMRSPSTTTKSSPHSPQLEKAPAEQQRPSKARNK